MEVFYTGSNVHKIDATLRECNSYSYNVIQEENKREM